MSYENKPTQRELEILSLLSTGLQYKEIADHLFISEGTVKQHLHKIYKKLAINNRTEATLWWLNHIREIKNDQCKI